MLVSIRVLACDYDGTLATDGAVGEATTRALHRWRASGRQLVLVTGRQLPDIQRAFPSTTTLFEWVVAENGPVLFKPATGERRLLANPPPAAFIDRLRTQGASPLYLGDVVVATTRENADAVLNAIEVLDLRLELIFNKASLMVLPSGVSKATGLTAALKAMAVAPAEVAGIGDAENDAALIGICGLGVAVANAIPELKAQADRVMRGEAGAGVIELIEEILAAEPSPAPAR